MSCSTTRMSASSGKESRSPSRSRVKTTLPAPMIAIVAGMPRRLGPREHYAQHRTTNRERSRIRSAGGAAMPAPDVLVIGDANPDLLLTGAMPEFGQAETLVDSAELVLGGSAAIVACGLARLGVATALAATVGHDLYGGFVRDALTERGVDVRWLRTD